MKKCPDSFVECGAASVALRHALFDLDALFADLSARLKACEPDMRKLGIARMEIAPAELLFSEASQSVLKLMAGHNELKAMLDRHGIANPTDKQILACHKKQGLKAVDGSSLKAAVTLGNYR